MQMQQTTYPRPTISGEAMSTPRNRCIELVLKEIEAELAETANSSVNLADKLRGATPEKTGQGQNAPDPADVFSRLEKVLNTIRVVNQELGHAHNAISG